MAEYGRAGRHLPPPPDFSDASEAESSDDDAVRGLRTSTDIRQHDRSIIEGEEEVEKLLTAKDEQSGFKNMFRRKDGAGNEVKISDKQRRQYKREARREGRRNRRKRRKEEESELMYEMEEGGPKDSSDSSGNSSEIDRQKLGDVHTSRTTSHKSRFGKFAGIHIVIVIAFLALLFGAYKASRSTKSKTQPVLNTLWNGTSTFAPTTLLISLDGFRADFLHRNLTPSLSAFIKAGVSPDYMLPSFPSVTFPNHFTLVTGLYPEAHGVVGNTFWDPTLQEEFYYTDTAHSMQSKWWQGEPVWETAESEGVRSAIHMWPGSEAHIGDVEPAYVDKYNGKEALSNKVNRILELLDIPGPGEPSADVKKPRPQLIAAYVPNVDADGHLYGPNSTEITTTIKNVDTMLGDLFRGLEQRNLSEIVNVIIVSDHGMASTSTSRLIQFDDLVDMSLIDHIDGWPSYGLRPKYDGDIELLYQRLKAEASTSDAFEVYLRDRDMPERYHFTRHERIAPLWVIPKTGWAIVTRKEFDVKDAKAKGLEYHPKGIHGYDHEHPLMRAIFVARGPAFPHTPGSKVNPFQNIEVYNLVCDSVGITPKPNNGTLRLPLKPVGVHDEAPPAHLPDDFPDAAPLEAWPTAASTLAVEELAEESPSPATSTQVESAVATRPTVHDGLTQDEEDKDAKNYNHWWQWVHGKFDGLKDWATDLFDKANSSTTKSSDG
ncbi:hypothetical protein MBLNU459_g3098t1 [Dothideomycetes sp. NU459]